jgi:hypothetical protein
LFSQLIDEYSLAKLARETTETTGFSCVVHQNYEI